MVASPDEATIVIARESYHSPLRLRPILFINVFNMYKRYHEILMEVVNIYSP